MFVCLFVCLFAATSRRRCISRRAALAEEAVLLLLLWFAWVPAGTFRILGLSMGVLTG